jgi:cyclic-di-AMP phosphodiesterase PgpH
MSFFGTRRPRQARVFRPSPTLRDRLQSALRDYRVLTNLFVASLAVLLLTLATQAWNPQFSYRSGQFIPTGIQARVDFQVENVLATRRLRDEAERAAPLVLVQDYTVMDRLQSQLRDQLSDVANAESLKDVAERVRVAFGMDHSNATDESQVASDEAIFELLKAELSQRPESSGNRIEQLLQDYSELLADARLVGLMESSVAQRLVGPADSDFDSSQDVDNRNRPIQVVNEDGQAIHYGVLADVLLQEQLKESGRLGKMWPSLEELQAIREPIETWLRRNLTNQLRFDPEATEEEFRLASENSPKKYDVFTKGATLIPALSQLGENEDQLILLGKEHDEYASSISWTQRLGQIIGTVLVLALLVILFGAFLKLAAPELLTDMPRLLMFILLCSLTVLLSSLVSHDPWRAEIIPLMAAAMITAIAFGQIVALLTTFGLSLVISMATMADLGQFIVLTTICITAVLPLRRVKSRLTMIKAGFLVSLVGFYASWTLGIIQAFATDFPVTNTLVLINALKTAGWCLVCCYLVAGSLPFIESGFGIVTDISLLELTAVSHPLLQELARRAPGTYNHSMTVATLAEAASEAIGANGLLARVGAYFHDIGKMMKPEYFIENMTEGSENPHQTLAPAMSTLIIIGHVKDGVELAEENNLPRPLIDFIEQHHGTTLVEYFFHEAARNADEDHRTNAEEASFRYPGPRPQSRETAVLMLADAVESASRTLTEPTPKRIQSLVHEITMKRLLDGQFDECDLRMAEIRILEESLIKSLLAAHHGRVKYPTQQTA